MRFENHQMKHLTPQSKFRNSQSAGFSLLELIITLSILSILVVAVVPLTKNNLKRQREYELKQNLRELRQAIDRFQADCANGLISELDRGNTLETLFYPPTLDILVDGVSIKGSLQKRRYLRRMPRDPMTGKEEWATRSVQDDPQSDSTDGKNVYDVYSKSTETALNGTKYKDW
jgi:general secretion pathway protein G